MVFYSVIFVILMMMSFLELFYRKNNSIIKLFSIILFILFLVLFTIRGGTRGDYKTYKEVWTYMTHAGNLFAQGNFFYEPLYSLIQFICKCITNNFQFFLFVIGVLVMSLQYAYGKNIKIYQPSKEDENSDPDIKPCKIYCEENLLITFLLIMWGLYTCNIFVIRSSIALVICMWGSKFIENKDPIKFLITVLIATGFHYSALVFLLAYPIYWHHSNLKSKIIKFVISTLILSVCIGVVALFAGNILGGAASEKITTYVSNSGDSSFATGYSAGSTLLLYVKAAMNIVFILIIGFLLWKNYKDDYHFEGYLNLYMFGSVLYIATLTIGYAFARLSIYYNVFQIPILLYGLNLNLRKQDNLLRHKVLLWLILCAYLYLRLYVNNASLPFIPFWSK